VEGGTSVTGTASGLPPAELWGWAHAVLLAAFVLAQLLLVIYALHRYAVLWRWWRFVARRNRAPAATRAEARAIWPKVTVQLPIYNERLVVERLIDSVARLDYPGDRLEIQVLDDSIDDTRQRAAAAVARHRARGIDIRCFHRRRRAGYKAGALAVGLAQARGDLIAVFDADFVPPPDFLRRLVPAFDDPRVGMAQARWTHLNRGASWLTAAQAVMLDGHFLLEHSARAASGLFFNFNGTAGVWRRACIEDAGGWTNDTLTEDLDLSYRAQLRGWRFHYDPDVLSPGELPGDIEALKSQQRRWAKGSVQTARKLLPDLLAAPIPRRVKVEAMVHLTGNVVYPLLVGVALFVLPIQLGTAVDRSWLAGTLEGGMVAFGLVPVVLFLAVARRVSGGSGFHVVRDVGAALMLGVGLSLNNARAVLEGLRGEVGNWERTPKTGDGSPHTTRARRYRAAGRYAGWAELALALYAAGVAALASAEGHYPVVPFLVLLGCGSLYVGVQSLQSAGGAWARGQRRMILRLRRPRRALRVSTIPRA